MYRPKVTILIPTHNRAHLIEETLDSIREQTYPYWECFIVDDFSTDLTGKVVGKYVKRDGRFFYFPKISSYTGGPSGSRNYGLDIAKERGAEFIQFFDDDDIMHPEKLEFQIAPLQKDKALDLSLCKYKRFVPGEDVESSKFISEINIESKNLAEDFLFGKIRVNSAGPLFRAHLFENERFDEELSYGEERECFLRIFFRYRPKYIAINQILFFYRYHPKSLTLGKLSSQEKSAANLALVEKLWEYLHRNRLLNHWATAFFLRKFLLENHNKEYIRKVYDFTMENNRLSKLDNQKFRFLIKTHSLYTKISYKLLLLKV